MRLAALALLGLSRWSCPPAPRTRSRRRTKAADTPSPSAHDVDAATAAGAQPAVRPDGQAERAGLRRQDRQHRQGAPAGRAEQGRRRVRRAGRGRRHPAGRDLLQRLPEVRRAGAQRPDHRHRAAQAVRHGRALLLRLAEQAARQPAAGRPQAGVLRPGPHRLHPVGVPGRSPTT